jgi:hypothetical protein
MDSQLLRQLFFAGAFQHAPQLSKDNLSILSHIKLFAQ